MKSLTVMGLAASLTGMAQAHTLFTTLYINDAKQGDGTCVRQSTDIDHANSPVVDLGSDNMACNVGGNTPVNFTCPAPAGAKLTFEYRQYPDKAQPGFIDPSHKGPVAVYAKKLASLDDTASGPGWFKLWGEGYDAAADLWATEKMIANDGLLSIDIPTGLPAGNYLFRPEVVAMHNTTPAVQPQFYVGCAQVFIESSVTADDLAAAVPANQSVSIPDYLQADDASVTYNIYDDEEYADPKIPFPMMGPVPWTPAPASGAPSGNVVKQSEAEGAIPDSCLIVNANWCGVEVPAYADQTGCWAAVDQCWAQNDACWAQAPASGGLNCKIWATKCDDLDAHCTARDWEGPPAFGLVSGEVAAAADIPAAVNAGDEDGSGAGGFATSASATASATTATASETAAGTATATVTGEAYPIAETTAETAAASSSTSASADADSTSVVATVSDAGSSSTGAFGASSTAAASDTSAAANPTHYCAGHKKRRHARQLGQ
ncbi:Uu.00g084320.m01.CDS01 [Anthostomella pinea]|uniref:lytic cellulose monooxygenase (C4-dehydrogenating) n=1 Tax=Anthostomella pinea TaxID=933095 RepID=A0AAI8YJK2_9PEZI|nr:Uu.00g084320.m01.CDS01 [Anthostomella pinea]